MNRIALCITGGVVASLLAVFSMLLLASRNREDRGWSYVQRRCDGESVTTRHWVNLTFDEYKTLVDKYGPRSLDTTPPACSLPRVKGVGREGGSLKALVVYFDREPTNDDMRAFHDFIRIFGTAND